MFNTLTRRVECGTYQREMQFAGSIFTKKHLKTNSEWPQSGPCHLRYRVDGKAELFIKQRVPAVMRGFHKTSKAQEASRVEPRILRPMHYKSSAWDFLLKNVRP